MSVPSSVLTVSDLPHTIAVLCSRATVACLLQQLGIRRSWRVFTPVVVIWALVLQRLSSDHSGDAIVTLLHAGAADYRDATDPHPLPLAHRIRSQSTAAWAQARAPRCSCSHALG